MAFSNEKACDAPVGQCGIGCHISALIMDTRQLFGHSELAPANTGFILKYQGGVSAAFFHALLFQAAFFLGRLAFILAMIPHAPTPVPHTIVGLNKAFEVGPGAYVQRFDDETRQSVSRIFHDRMLYSTTASRCEDGRIKNHMFFYGHSILDAEAIHSAVNAPQTVDDG